MPNYDFKCECGKEEERVVPYGVDEIQCECGKTMTKFISKPPLVIAKCSGMPRLRQSSRK